MVCGVVSTFLSSTGGVTGVVVGVEEGVEDGVDVGVVVGALSPPYCWAGDVSPAFFVVSSTTASWTLGAVAPVFGWTDVSRVWAWVCGVCEGTGAEDEGDETGAGEPEPEGVLELLPEPPEQDPLLFGKKREVSAL